VEIDTGKGRALGKTAAPCMHAGKPIKKQIYKKIGRSG
jgi:hypothetical protein